MEDKAGETSHWVRAIVNRLSYELTTGCKTGLEFGPDGLIQDKGRIGMPLRKGVVGIDRRLATAETTLREVDGQM